MNPLGWMKLAGGALIVVALGYLTWANTDKTKQIADLNRQIGAAEQQRKDDAQELVNRSEIIAKSQAAAIDQAKRSAALAVQLDAALLKSQKVIYVKTQETTHAIQDQAPVTCDVKPDDVWRGFAGPLNGLLDAAKSRADDKGRTDSH